MNFSPRTQVVQLSAIRRIRQLANEFSVDLSLGEPDFPINRILVQELQKTIARGYSKYSSNQGNSELRQVLAEHYCVDKEMVLVTVGAAEAIFLSVNAFAQGGKIAVFTPQYPAVSECAKIAGSTVTEIPLENACRLPKNFEEKLSNDTELVSITTPNNPTSAYLNSLEIRRVSEKCSELEIPLLADECYEYLAFNQVESALKYENVIKVSSASKTFSAPGLRVGWLIAEPEIIEKITPLHQYCVSCAPTLEQIALSNCFHDCLQDESQATMMSEYKKRADKALRKLTEIGLSAIPPQAAFYLFAKIPTENSQEFCEKLAREKNVLIVPGSGFGTEGYARISLTKPVELIEEGIEKIGEFIK